jgi:hypothetical protein
VFAAQEGAAGSKIAHIFALEHARCRLLGYCLAFAFLNWKINFNPVHIPPLGMVN